MVKAFRLRASPDAWAPFAIGGWAAAVATVPDTPTRLLLAAPAPVVAAAWWLILTPERWMHALFAALVLLPPFAIGAGNSGGNVAPVFLIPGLAAGLLRSTEWAPRRGTLLPLMLLFLAVAATSVPLAAFYSGPQVAAGSLARVCLLGIGVYVFAWTLCGPRRPDFDPFVSARLVYWFGLAGALFACVDFYFQLPAPAGFGPQFVWLDSGVFRRAQGLFYEASTLGNFCAFFLVMILVASFGPSGSDKTRRFSRVSLALGCLLFSGALIFSYSRASALNLVVAGLAFLCVRKVPVQRLLATGTLLGIATAAILRFALPGFFAHYFSRLAATFEYLGEAPNLTLSGRVAMWRSISSFLAGHPLDAILGIGYKTLPYSNYAGQGLVADNTYLSLLVETGVIGLAVFLLMNGAILRTAWRAARSGSERAAFFGAWIFCFWCGELAQMLSGDLITYWRVLPLYFWVLATAARETSE